MHIHAHDLVTVRTGKDRGKQGKILRVLAKRDRVVVEGVNMSKRHRKPTAKLPHGGIITMEAPIHVSNVSLVCSECGKATKVGIQVSDAGPIRICRRCSSALPIRRK